MPYPLMSSYRLALFVRIGGQFLSVLLSALLVLTFLTSGRSHEPMLFTSIALAAAGAGWPASPKSRSADAGCAP